MCNKNGFRSNIGFYLTKRILSMQLMTGFYVFPQLFDENLPNPMSKFEVMTYKKENRFYGFWNYEDF
jgi:hypothetical protein